MAGAYYVTLNREKCGHNLRDGGDAMVVYANDATAAKQICQAKFPGDGTAWINDSTATLIAAAADFNGWTFDIDICGGFGVDNAEPRSVRVVGDATTNLIDEIGAALVTALNALPVIANAAYDNTTQVLTIAGAADNLGDQKVLVRITPPNGESSVDSLIGTITDEGAAGAALSVVLPADAAVIPQVVGVCIQTG